ncbi:hypothetical protein WJX73_003521 [Symbiochloris irregularis]|uniref:G-patch domain-containing protein n=1 Tax=Symbiochloris irregularis TaxID=706552 RepID=A0AAW1NVV6_9CHLO
MADPFLREVAPLVQPLPMHAAGRGEEFSADAQREKARRDWEAMLDDEDGFRIPIGVRIEDSLDTGGLQMASVHEFIPESNKGFQMLQRMGWKGAGLGKNETGIQEPISGGVEAGLRIGLGKQQQDDQFTSAENVQRKQLESELQANEAEERTKWREELVEAQQRISADVQASRRPLYCETCHKQYNSASELEVHLSSYDHHHRKRLIEMRQEEMGRTKRDRDKRERKRLDKEAARLNQQIQRAQQTHAVLPSSNDPPPPPPDDSCDLVPPPPLEPSPSFPPSFQAMQAPAVPPAQGHGVQMSLGRKAPLIGKAPAAFHQPKAAPFSQNSSAKHRKLQPAVAAFQMDDDEDD